MNNIIDDLYLGNINPNENIRIVHEGYRKLAKEAGILEKWILEKFFEDGVEKFHEFIEKNASMNAIEVRIRFIEGFRLGAQIMLDVLTRPALNGSEDD